MKNSFFCQYFLSRVVVTVTCCAGLKVAVEDYRIVLQVGNG